MKSLTHIFLNPNVYYGVFLFCLGMYFGKDKLCVSDVTDTECADTECADTVENTECHIGSWTISENSHGNLIFMKNKKILREILYY